MLNNIVLRYNNPLLRQHLLSYSVGISPLLCTSCNILKFDSAVSNIHLLHLHQTFLKRPQINQTTPTLSLPINTIPAKALPDIGVDFWFLFLNKCTTYLPFLRSNLVIPPRLLRESKSYQIHMQYIYTYLDKSEVRNKRNNYSEYIRVIESRQTNTHYLPYSYTWSSNVVCSYTHITVLLSTSTTNLSI